MIQSQDAKALDGFQDRIDYRFKNPALLQEALTHPSAVGSDRADNERLEFLGDRVLGLVVADRLLERNPDMDEGGLARALNALVRKEACVKVAKAVGLDQVIWMDEGEERSGGRKKKGVLGDACEALIAAIYLDGGLEAARRFILSEWNEAFDKAEVIRADAKTALQEWAHAKHKETPVYDVLARQGPDHDPLFRIKVSVGKSLEAEGEGRSKRAAESEAAALLLRQEGVWS